MLEREQAYFEAHKADLRAQHTGKRIIIVGEEVRGEYVTDGEAYKAATLAMKLKPGEFMIKLVTATDEEAIQRFMNRVYA
jgi:uridylate kinase